MTRMLPLFVVLVLVAGGRADPVADKLKAAQEAARAGRHDAADQVLAAALAEVPATDPKRRADIQARRLDNLADWQKTENVSGDRLVSAYMAVKNEQALQGSDVWRRAVNNLGVRHLTDGRPADAAAAFRDLFQAGDPPMESAYLFQANYARALELTGDPLGAADRFLASLKARPAYGRAADGLVRVLKAMSAKKDTPAGRTRVSLAEAALNVKGLPPLTLGAMTTDLLIAWRDEAAADILLPHLVRYYATLPVTAGRFAEVEKARLDEIAKSDRLRARMAELTAAYTEPGFAPGPDPVMVDGRTALREWGTELNKPGVAADFARLLKVAGDGFRSRVTSAADRDNTQAALRRYSAAYYLEPRSADAYRACIGLLIERRRDFDSNGALLRQCTDMLFGGKSDLYGQARTRADFVNLLNMHVLLASTYELIPGTGGNSAQTPAFQWRQAIRAEHAIRGERDPDFQVREIPDPEPDYPRSPEVRFRLAEALRKTKAVDRAVRYYREAVDLALAQATQVDDPSAPSRVTDQARKYLDALDPAVRAADPAFARLAELQRQLEKYAIVWDRPVAAGAATLAFLPTGRDRSPLLAVGSADRIDCWAVGSARPEPASSWMNPGARLVATEAGLVNTRPAGSKTDLVVHHPDKGTSLLGHAEGGLTGLTASARGPFFAALDGGGKVRVWDTRKVGAGALAGAWSDAGSKGVEFSPLGDMLLQLTPDTVSVFAIDDGAIVTRLAERDASHAAVAPGGDRVAVVRKDGTVVVRPTQGTGAEVRLKDQPSKPTDLQFTPDGNRLITLGPDTAVRVWDPATGTEVVRFGHSARPTALMVSADGKYLAIAVPLPDGGTRAVVRELRR